MPSYVQSIYFCLAPPMLMGARFALIIRGHIAASVSEKLLTLIPD